MSTPDLITPLHHCAECDCPRCERCGLGIFAQRAALAGDSSAAARLSPAVAAALASLRTHRPRRRPHEP